MTNTEAGVHYGSPGEVRVATTDVNGDGKADIIVAAGPGEAPRVKIFNGTELDTFDAMIADFLADTESFRFVKYGLGPSCFAGRVIPA